MLPEFNQVITPSLTINQLSLTDISDIVSLANDWQVAKFLREVFPHPYTKEDAEAFLTVMGVDNSQIALAIRYEKHFAGVIGAVFHSGLFEGNLEVGFWLGSKFQNRGIISAVLPEFCKILFKNYQCRRLFAGVLDGNIPSMRVLLKSGFRLEGTYKNAAFNRNEVFTYHIFGILQEEVIF